LNSLKEGVYWDDMHILAEKTINKHLIKYGLIKDADMDELVEKRIGANFFPHGLGHFIGTRVHDVGGYNKNCPERRTEPGLRSLRTRRQLKAGMAMTVEPGCYFIDFILDKAYNDPEQSKYLNKAKIQEYMDVGGVRLEDDLLITKDGHINLTYVPRTVEEVEACMAGKEWRK